MNYYVYILSNKARTVLYVGVTNNLQRRLLEHKNGEKEGFTKKYNVNLLMFYESCGNINNAICREKEIKGWTRNKKLELIRTINSSFADLSKEVLG